VTGDDSDVKMAATDNSATPKCALKPKKRPTDSAIKEAKKKNKSVEEENGVHGGSSDEATDNEEEETEEQKEWLDENVELVDVEGKDITQFNPDLWKINDIPDKHTLPFLGKSGPQHTLAVGSATPFEYFCLFIPIFYWDRWAKYTNEKAAIEMDKQPAGRGRRWDRTSAAELKAWVASVIWWCLGATQSLNCFWNDNYERSRMKHWFGAGVFRWMQLKRFFKVSSSEEDAQHKTDKLHKVRDLWEDQVQYEFLACTASGNR